MQAGAARRIPVRLRVSRRAALVALVGSGWELDSRELFRNGRNYVSCFFPYSKRANCSNKLVFIDVVERCFNRSFNVVLRSIN